MSRLKRATVELWRSGSMLALLSIVVVGILIWWWPGFEPPPVSAVNPHSLYLFSAIAQSLAAILALVFTISLVVAQLSSRYSHRMLSDFFDLSTIEYIFLFITAIVLPLWLLGLEQPPLWAIRVSLTMTSAALLLLVPYFLRFRDKLNPESVLNGLKEKAVRQLQAEPKKEPAEIATIDNFCMSAFAFKDYDTFDRGVRTLAALALETSKSMKDSIGKSMFYRLLNIGLVTIEDPIAPLRVLVTLRDTGLEAIKRGLEPALEWSTFPQSNIGARAVEKRLDALGEQAVVGLTEVGRMAVDCGLDGTLRVFLGLYEVGYKAVEVGQQNIFGVAYLSMDGIASEAGKKGLRNDITEQMSNLLQLLKHQADMAGERGA